MFEPRLALASLSGESDAEWATVGAPYAGAAFLGGIAIDEPTREAARQLRDRDRTEFLPEDPVRFVESELEALATVSIQPAWNVRAVNHEALREVATVCAAHDAILEINAHCRQDEICATGAGERLLREPARLAELVRTASEAGATVSVKCRAELDDVALPAVLGEAEAAGAEIAHVDAMDDERIIHEIADETGCFLVANNGVRDHETVHDYLDAGADAVSVGRPSDNPSVLETVSAAVTRHAVGGTQ